MRGSGQFLPAVRQAIWASNGTLASTLDAVHCARREALGSELYTFERARGASLVDAARRYPKQASIGACGWTAAELARFGADPASLRARPELAPFLAWIADKPEDFHAPTARRRSR